MTRRLLLLLPLLLFLVTAVYLARQLLSGRDPAHVPSALIGKSVPETILPPLKAGKPGFARVDFGTRDFPADPVLVNVFASWCVPCRAEHPYISALGRLEGVALYGFNVKDERKAALDWLQELGDPYARIGFDPAGRNAVEWGVYGYPETFLISPEGIVIYKHVGPLHPELIEREIMPRLRDFREGRGG